MVSHAAGETKVPLQPQRIAAMYVDYTDFLVALGVADRIAATVADNDAPNLETLVGAHPDLIVGADWQTDLYPN